jgi:PEP-CTERM motif
MKVHSKIALPLMVALTGPAWSINVFDGDFASWSSYSFVTDDPFVAAPGPNTSTGSAVRLATGGSPGAYFGVNHTFSTGDTIWTGGIKTDYSLDLSSAGAITSLAVAVDLVHPQAGSTAWQLVVQQAGTRYYSVPWSSFSGTAGWAHYTASGLTAASFSTNPWVGYAGITSDGSHPNFNSDGAPIQFGFMFGNRVIGNGTITNSIGMDNFLVVTTAVPEPTTIALTLSGLALLGLRGLRLRQEALR